MYHFLPLLIIKIYAINDFALLKPAATLLFLKEIIKVRTWAKRDFQKKGENFKNTKALAAIAEDV